MIRTIARFLGVLLVVSALAVAVVAAARLETIDAEIHTGRIVSLTDERIAMQVDGQARTFPRNEVVEVVLARAKDVMSKNGQVVLVTTAGDLLAADDLRLDAGRLSCSVGMLTQTSVPIEAIRFIYMPTVCLNARNVRSKCDEMKLTGAAADRLVVVKDDKIGAWLNVEGVLKAIDEKNVIFRWDDKDVKVARRIVRAICLPALQPDRADVADFAGELVGKDGSTLAFDSVHLGTDETQFVVDSPCLGVVRARRDRVAAIRFRSDRIMNLADLTPAEAKQRGVFDAGFPYRINRAAGGGPLRLGGKVYRTGLGLHSFCELTYELKGRYSRFVAVVGIDDAVRPLGNATVTLLADGKALAEPIRVTGKSDATTVRLNVAGAKLLTIRVDFGADSLDVADHVNIVKARLIK